MEEKPVVFILRGDDPVAMEQFVDALFARMGDPGLAELNTVRLDGRTASDEDIQTATISMPFLAERRLAILTHPLDKLKAAAAQQRFTALLDRLPATTALVLIQEDSLRWNSRSKGMDWDVLHDGHWIIAWAHQAGKRANVRDFLLPRQENMPGWIMKYARENHGEFSLAAAQSLAALVGNDTQVAKMEIDKLLTYVDYQRPVEDEDVADLTAAISLVNVFDMADALSAGDSSGALRMLAGLLEVDDPIRLFGAVVGHFRALLLTREILEEGGGSAQVKADLHKPQFVTDKLVRQAQRFSMDELEDLYRHLEQMDEHMKSGGMRADLALQTLIVSLRADAAQAN